MIDYAQALQRMLAQMLPLASESCALGDAIGRVLAADIVSPMALPSFDHAAMDGYALDAHEPRAAGSEHEVRGSQAAGDCTRTSSGAATEIMTGARLPADLDAVIAVERTALLASHADGSPARIRLLDSLSSGGNVRHLGADVARDAVVIVAGTCIETSHIMLLAALGVANIEVVRKPRVAIVCTGSELQSDPAQRLADGHIHNSNGPYLVAALLAAGAEVLSNETVDDTEHHYTRAVERAAAACADLLVSTGAVSMGRHDFVPGALQQLGAELLFHGVAIRPGRPLLCARLANRLPILALPGTPMAVAVGLRFFIVPALRRMAGQGSEPSWHAMLETPQQPRPGLRHFLRATLHQDIDGRLRATLSGQQQPFRIRPFADADAWVVLPEDAGDCVAGTRVEIVSLDPRVSPPIGTADSSGHRRASS
ncbi:MAG: gephyrin-like molybdotransferase Glp [Rhodanobacter sp.]